MYNLLIVVTVKQVSTDTLLSNIAENSFCLFCTGFNRTIPAVTQLDTIQHYSNFSLLLNRPYFF